MICAGDIPTTQTEGGSSMQERPVPPPADQGPSAQDTIVPQPAAPAPAPAPQAKSQAAAASPPAPDEFAARWDAVAAIFVDDPRRAVQEADRLLGEVVQRITDERERLRGQAGKPSASTEDLRIALQHYRDLLHELTRRPA
jgi:hypothetical protein